MSLKTYDRHYTNDTLVGAKAPDVREPLPWPFNVIDDDGVLVIDSWTEIAPGKWITHTSQGGKGMVVAVNDEQLTVLWSDEPRGLDNFSNIAMPLVRRVFAPQIANQLVSIQPMSLPAASIFYMDYAFGDDLDRKCTQGPWWSRVYHRSKRWLMTQKKKLNERSTRMLISLLTRIKSFTLGKAPKNVLPHSNAIHDTPTLQTNTASNEKWSSLATKWKR